MSKNTTSTETTNNNEVAPPFVEATEEIIEISKVYEAYGVRELFLDILGVFLEVTRNLGAEAKGISRTEVKMKIFEKMFDINIEEEIEKKVQEYIQNNTSDADTADVDAELLESIRSNFNEYLKD